MNTRAEVAALKDTIVMRPRDQIKNTMAAEIAPTSGAQKGSNFISTSIKPGASGLACQKNNKMTAGGAVIIGNTSDCISTSKPAEPLTLVSSMSGRFATFSPSHPNKGSEPT